MLSSERPRNYPGKSAPFPYGVPNVSNPTSCPCQIR